MLLSLLVAEKTGFAVSDNPELSSLKEFADRMSRQAIESMEQAAAVADTPVNPGGNGGAPAVKAPARTIK